MSLPLEHLSASSISKFLRCPRQFQEQYIRGEKGPSNSALIIGSAVHLALSRSLKGEDPGDFWNETVAAALEESPEIIWKDNPERAEATAMAMAYHYYEKVGKWLDVEATEQEILFEVPGVPIPVLGYVDIVTPRGVIDVKTTGYLSRRVFLNPEWKLQGNIYQLVYPKPTEFHVITRAKTDPLVVPDSPEHFLYVRPVDSEKLQVSIKRIYEAMEAYYGIWGEEYDWPGNMTHEWAAKYCSLKGRGCCQEL